MINIGIRLDTGATIGLGHFMRCLSLANALSKFGDFKIYFICRNKINLKVNYEVIYLNKEYTTGKNSYSFPSIYDEIEEVKAVLQQYDISCLIVDHYGARDDYFSLLRNEVKNLACMDDSLERRLPVDCIINGNIYGKDANYGDILVQLTGGDYTLLREEFQEVSVKRIKKDVTNVYVTSGGADPLRFCKTMLEIVRKVSADIAKENNMLIHIVAGSDFEEDYVKDLRKSGAIIHCNANMRNCMEEADLFLTSGGSTLYELAVCGVPSISFVLAQDQELVASYMWKAGTSISGGWFSEMDKRKVSGLIENLILDWEIRKRLSQAGKRTINSMGAENTAKAIHHWIDFLQ